MQTANIMLDIGGDNGNQVPKYGVTAAEIAVLIAIHGEAAVHDIEPIGTVERSNRDELTRLREVYGRAKDGEDHSHVDILFPGAAARVFENIDELNLPPEFFKPTARASAPAAADPLDHDGDGKKGGSKKGDESTRSRGKAKKADAPASDETIAAEGIPPGDDPEADDKSDGVEDMPDNEGESLFK